MKNINKNETKLLNVLFSLFTKNDYKENPNIIITTFVVL